ncbi:MAG: GTP 3',8-cyclase MoaA [Dehalococcoidia bacterium]|jgi:cyclic pyranopterin phosphate synthase
MAGICDSFQRGISYLRISVTDRCNLRCVYCMPPEGVPLVPHKEIMSFEEIMAVVKTARDLGINKVRITGGEPLVRLGVIDLVRMISAVEGIKDISMTTNGTLLAEHVEGLVDAGLHRINISLDTLKYDRFKQITRTGDLSDALKGIHAAIKAGLNPVKINMVPMQGFNDDEIIDFAMMTIEAGWHVRFIELMPMNRTAEFVPSGVLRKRIESLGPLEPFRGIAGNGAARYFRLPSAKGTLGFISPVSEPFCEECNRLRLSSTGMLLPCLFSSEGVDIKTPIRQGASEEDLKSLITAAISAKPKKHNLNMHSTADKNMSSIGG